MKLLKVLLPLALCFVLLAGCGKKVELAGWEDYKDHPTQDVYAGEVAAPERIVMTRDGREKNSFDKGTETYEKIVSTLGQLIEAQLDENEEAAEDFRHVLQLSPSNLETMEELVRVYEKLGRTDLVEKYEKKIQVVKENIALDQAEKAAASAAPTAQDKLS